jgi:hypothetical protein
VTPVPGGLIVPEESNDATSAATETSVWKDRQSNSGSQ